MARSDDVLDAIDRWQRTGLVDGELAARLRADAEEDARRSGRRLSQYALAATGGAVLVIAVGVLADWLWPLLDEGLRSLVLAVVGIAVHAVGRELEGRRRALPAAWVLQSSGLLVLLGAFVYSEEQWADLTGAGVAVGLASLVLPALLAVRALGRNAVMPAVHLALAPAFLAVFLDRATPLEAETIVLVLDLFLVALGALLLRRLARERDRDAVDRHLIAFATAVNVGLVLVVLTGVITLDLEERAVWWIDAWWAGATLIAVWGLERAPRYLRRDWFERQIAWNVLLAVPLAFFTTLELLVWSPEGAAVAVGALGGAGLWYGFRGSRTRLIQVSGLPVIAAAFYYGVEEGGVLGAVLALLFTAAFLFWLSVRLGRDDEGEDGDGENGEDRGVRESDTARG